MFSTSLCGVKSNAHKHTRHTRLLSACDELSIWQKELLYLQSDILEYFLLHMKLCVCSRVPLCVRLYVCVYIKRGYSWAWLILDHTAPCETPVLRNSSESQSHRVSVCGGSWAPTPWLYPPPLSVSLLLSSSLSRRLSFMPFLFFSASKLSYFPR